MEPTSQYLTFRIGDESYGLDVANAREIVEGPSLTPMPKAPPWVRGVLNLRGSIVPVLDLKRKFEMGETEIGPHSVVVIVEFELEGEEFVVGMLADRALEVFEYEPKDIEAPPKFGARYAKSYLRGVGRRAGYLFVILAAEKVFADTDTLVLEADGSDAMTAATDRESAHANV